MEPQTSARNGLTVEGVGVDGVPDGREVDPDLVRPPGLQTYREHRVPRAPAQTLGGRPRRFPHARRHEGRVRGIPAHRRVDLTRDRQPLAYDQGPVDAPHAPLTERCNEPRIGLLVLGDDHEARCVPIQTMHHPRALRILTARDAPAQEGIDQRPRAVSRPRMHHEPCGLVYHEEMLVLEDARNGDVFGFGLRFEETGLDPLPATRFAGRRALLGAIYPHEAFLDKAPRHAPTRVEAPGDDPVQALPGLLGRYLEAVAFSSHLLATSEIRARSEVSSVCSVFQRRSFRRARSSSAPEPRTKTSLSRLCTPLTTVISERDTSRSRVR